MVLQDVAESDAGVTAPGDASMIAMTVAVVRQWLSMCRGEQE